MRTFYELELVLELVPELGIFHSVLNMYVPEHDSINIPWGLNTTNSAVRDSSCRGFSAAQLGDDTLAEINNARWRLSSSAAGSAV